MGKRIKKVITMGLLISVLATLIAGCGKTAESNQTQTSQVAASQTEQKDTTAKEASIAKGITFPYTGPQVDLTGLWVDLSLKPDTLLDKEYQKKIGNIKITWDLVTWADYDTKVKLALSSGELPDITIVNDVFNKVQTYSTSGILLDWNEYKNIMPNYQKMSQENPSLDWVLNSEDQRYVLYGSADRAITSMGFVYNKTLFDKAGLKAPNTTDELLNVLRQLKKYDKSIIPYISYFKMDELAYMLSRLFGQTEGGISFDTASGKWYYGLFKADNTYRKSLEFLHTLYEEELLDPEINTATAEQTDKKIRDGKWGLMYYYAAFDEWKFPDIKLDWEMGFFLTPTYNGNAVMMVERPTVGKPNWGLIGSAKTKNPELLAALMDYNYSDEITTLWNWGIEGTTYKVNADGKKEFLPDVKNSMNQKGTIDLTSLGLFNMKDLQTTRRVEMDALMLTTYPGPKEIEAINEQSAAFKSGRLIPANFQPLPAVTSEEASKVSNVMNPIDTYIKESSVSFVTGKKSIDKWDDFIAEIKKMGDVDSILQIYNSKKQYNVPNEKF